MRRLGGRIPPPDGCRWTQAVADALVGQPATLAMDLFGAEATGVVVEARVMDDDLGHALWVTVEASGDDCHPIRPGEFSIGEEA